MSRITEFTGLTDEISQRTNVIIPSGYKYRYAPYNCWKCSDKMLIFTWVGEENDALPPEPVPNTVQHQFTYTTDSTYWANVCPHCNSVQGRFYLHDEPDSPFFVLDGVQDYKEAFDKDMEELTRYYYEELT